MPIDTDAARRFVLANARLLDRHRLAVLLDGAPVAPVLDALRAYRNPDGGFGHALEPDVRAPESEPSSTLHALEVLDEVGRLDDPMVAGAAAWLASISEPDGGVPFVMPTAMDHPRAPFIRHAPGGSFLTLALAGSLWRAGSEEPWLQHATEWCWARLERPDGLGAYGVKCALDFLDAVADEPRAVAAIERLRSAIGPDGAIAVTGGTEDERLTPLTLSERPDGRSRSLFTDEQIEADLNRLERGQQDDGGWLFDWVGWSPGQSVESRGVVTLRALRSLRENARS
ncbi:MAG TPA: hypothetical protein VHJ39_14070 [Solirubrobacteraceae bacterium]|jgi:hypothetical protein|nr:hypothetical protein [Solirubrobacteraceae bacterium]